MLSLPCAVTVLLFSIPGYIAAIVVYRLWLCPVAKFPGPWLAKVTFWYEGWYDIVRQGRYTWKIMELHEKYGVCCFGDNSYEDRNLFTVDYRVSSSDQPRRASHQ